MNLKEYRSHPRMLELRFSLIHSNMVMQFGLDGTAHILKGICDSARINWGIISSVIGRKEMILDMNRTNKMRYRQEVVFMGDVFEESRINTMKNYMRVSKRLLYEGFDGMLLPQRFLNEEWIDGLDYSIVVAGNKAYSNELIRILNILSILSEVITGVSVAKI